MSAALNSAQCLCVCVCVRNEVRQPQHKANRFVRMGCLIRRVCQGWARQNRWMGNTFSMQSGNLSRNLMVVLYSAYRKRSPEIWDCALWAHRQPCLTSEYIVKQCCVLIWQWRCRNGNAAHNGYKERFRKLVGTMHPKIYFPVTSCSSLYSTSWGNQLW